MKTLLTLAAALSLGLAGAASAASPDVEIGLQISKEASFVKTACCYRYFYRWHRS